MKSENSLGELPMTSMPCTFNAVFTESCFTASFAAFDRGSTISDDVPAGARSPIQMPTSKPASPLPPSSARPHDIRAFRLSDGKRRQLSGIDLRHERHRHVEHQIDSAGQQVADGLVRTA